MDSQSISIPLVTLVPPAILLLALNVPSLFHQNFATRVLITLLVVLGAGYVIATVHIENASLAFMTGLFEGWIVIWAAVLLIHFTPTTNARRRRWSKVPRFDGEFEEDGVVWQRYPRVDMLSRLCWTVDLLINFRGVGWQLGGADKSEHNTRAKSLQVTGARRVGVLKAWGTLFRDVLVFRMVLRVASRLENNMVESPWKLQALHTITWLATSVPFINFCHSTCTIVGETGEWIQPSELYQTERYNPSPWGPIGAIVEFGLPGLWGMTWHNYFKFGFQSAVSLVIPRTANPKLKPLTQMARMFLSFLLSGTIHACGSYMLPQPTQPSKEFYFFVWQGVAVIAQLFVVDRFVDKRLRRILNPIGIILWLYWTEPLIFGDQKDGGMWRVS